MTSPTDETNANRENDEIKQSDSVTTIQRIYNGENDEEDLTILRRNPETRRSFINKTAYVKLHQSSNSKNLRHSVDNLKGRYESIAQGNAQTNTLIKSSKSKDENSNVITDEIEVIRPAQSKESIDRITEELDNFIMDGKPKEKKRSNSFRRLLTGQIFSNKKKPNEEKNKNGETIIYHDNMRNENQNHNLHEQEMHESKIRELEIQYAEMHVNRFNQIKQTFVTKEDQPESPIREPAPKKSIADFISNPVNRYIDTSSSTSSEYGQNGQMQTFLRTRSEVQDRPLPDPYAGNKISPRTIERNLDNNINSKDYPDKASVHLEETYGTVFDRLDYASGKQVNGRPPASPKSPSLEGSKLRLPPNREIYELQPRMKSPIPSNRVSTDKIIATELLRRSPTPPRKVDTNRTKPPVTPRVTEKIVTNAMVHNPKQSLENIYNSNRRATTPIDLRMSTTMKVSPPPPKEDIRRSVEEYYWKELKKLKEEQDYNLRMMQLRNSFMEEQARVRRSRSLSPTTHRNAKRATSLPRENPNQYMDVMYGNVQQQAIPEDRVILSNGSLYNHPQNFIRQAPERRSVDTLQRPIFRRGSLSKQEAYENQTLNKRVSFSNSHEPQQAWPTRNGYTQSPPQRRIEMQRNSYIDDDVFLPPTPQEPIYGPRQYPPYNQQPVYVNAVQKIPRNYYVTNIRGQVPPQENYGNLSRYSSNSQLQPNSLHSSRQSMTDSIYGQKQVTVRNRYCDIYGQIHDAPSGVIMGQLQQGPGLPPRQPVPFVRGTRLTASANDIGIRYQNLIPQPTNYDQRPLPPIPRQSRVTISDTESVSDAGEVQRIIQNKPKNKKRGFFGK